MIVLNFSGHAIDSTLSQDNWLHHATIVDVNLGTLPMHDQQLLVETVKQTVEDLPLEAKQALQVGKPVVLALPGLSAAAAILLAAVHGFCGHWPKLTWASKTQDGFIWLYPVDLQDIRTDSRFLR